MTKLKIRGIQGLDFLKLVEVLCQAPRAMNISLTSEILWVGEVADHEVDGKHSPTAFPISTVQDVDYDKRI